MDDNVKNLIEDYRKVVAEDNADEQALARITDWYTERYLKRRDDLSKLWMQIEALDRNAVYWCIHDDIKIGTWVGSVNHSNP